MGRNGAGKSTLLRAAAGLVEPARGAIEAPGGCALLPQSPRDCSLRERVDDELPGRGGRAALAAVGLEWAARQRSARPLRRRAPAAGAGDRDGRARAAASAGLVCLDEPTRGMDGARKEELVAVARPSSRGRGSAVLVATHDVEFAARFADRVVLLGDGELIADGPADEILSGGWYFATEVARILGGDGAITPEAGAAGAARGARRASR